MEKFKSTLRLKSNRLFGEDAVPYSENTTYFDVEKNILYKDFNGQRFAVAEVLKVDNLNIGEYTTNQKRILNSIIINRTSSNTFETYYVKDDGTIALLGSGGGGGVIYSAGDGISFSPENIISVNSTVVRWEGDINSSYIQFDVNSQDGFEEGQLGWDSESKTLSLGLGNGVVLQIGQENHLYVRADANLTEGRVLKATGAVGGSEHLTCNYAISTEASKYIIGVATQSLTSGSFGYVTNFGVVRGVDLSYIPNIAVGNILYLKPNTTTGELTNIMPSGGHSKTPIAMVLSGSPTNWNIFVRPTYTFRVEDLDNTNISNLGIWDGLVFDGSNWINTKVLRKQTANWIIENEQQNFVIKEVISTQTWYDSEYNPLAQQIYEQPFPGTPCPSPGFYEWNGGYYECRINNSQDIITIYKQPQTSGGVTDAKVSINAKTTISELDFGGW